MAVPPSQTPTTNFKKKSHLKTEKKSCFPACFGFSGGVPRLGNGKHGGEKKPNKKDVGSGKLVPWFSFFKFRKKKSGRKTVPVDLTVSCEQSPSEEIKEVKEDLPGNSGISVKQGRNPAKTHVSVLPNSVSGAGESDQGISLKTRKGKFSNCPSQLSESSTPEVGQKPVIRKTQTHKSISQPGSPDTRTTTRVMSSCSSFPPPGRKKTFQPPGNSRLGVQNSEPETRILNPMAGLSILVITLAIMLLWGRLCAIICTSAWFYFVPRLRTTINSGDFDENSGKPDIDSTEYKKKVIMDGLLERTHKK